MNRLTRLLLSIIGFALFAGCSAATQPDNGLVFDIFLTVAGLIGFVAGIAGLVADS